MSDNLTEGDRKARLEAMRREWKAGHCSSTAAEFLFAELERVEAERDSLRLELNGLEFIRKRDNQYLLDARDAALAKVERLREALLGTKGDGDREDGPCWCDYEQEHLAGPTRRCAAARRALAATEPKRPVSLVDIPAPDPAADARIEALMAAQPKPCRGCGKTPCDEVQHQDPAYFSEPKP